MTKTERNRQIVESYQVGNITIKQIAKQYGLGYSTVHGILNKAITTHNKRKWFPNIDYFSNINSAEKAYWLGFIAADGNVHNTTLKLELHIQDTEHLRKFYEVVAMQKEVTITKRNRCVATINSRKLITDLLKHNITPHKTKTLATPKLRKDLYKHFYRGFFDGDGWVYSGISNQGYRRIGFGWGCASKNFAEDMYNWYEENIGQLPKLIHRKNGMYQVISESPKLFRVFYETLYQESTVYLERKHKRFMELLEIENRRKK